MGLAYFLVSEPQDSLQSTVQDQPRFLKPFHSRFLFHASLDESHDCVSCSIWRSSLHARSTNEHERPLIRARNFVVGGGLIPPCRAHFSGPAVRRGSIAAGFTLRFQIPRP